MKKKSNTLAIILIFFVMVLSAICDNIIGVFAPVLRSEFNINNTSISTMYMITTAGYMIFNYIGGILSRKLGHKKVFILGFIITIISLISITFSTNYVMFCIIIFAVNAGIGVLGIATNTIVPILFISFQAILMNLTHFCYAAGAAFAQKISGFLIVNGFTWRNIYLMTAVLAILIFLPFIFVNIPKVGMSKEGEKINFKEILSNKLIYAYMIGLGFYMAAEQGTGKWFVNYINGSYNMDINKSSIYASLFFFVFAMGRLFGGFIIEKFGYINTVIKFLIMAFVLYIAGLFIGQKGLYIVSISGLFFSITFPTMILTVGKVFTKESVYITGLIVTVASGINAIINFLMGVLNDSIGIGTAFFMMPLCLVISLIAIIIIHINTKELVK